MTSPELEREALALFEESLREPEAARDRWLAARAGERPELLSRVRAIADADRLAALATGAALRDAEPEAPLPERIGAYRITARLGHGGMGSVYRGERAAGDFEHVVAIKVIKPGLLGERLIERFRREREILAKLRHPGIAQLHDGGETDEGAPFIVMEYVEGQPLLDWAQDAQPSWDERLRVFGLVCDAVAFAHRALVVHRDLTPSNVMVTADGVKLIDFGIAKPADVLADAATTSRGPSLASLSLTPGYAAPERASGAPVTTAADIYSLGRLLDRLVPDGGPELRAIVARATATAPADRYPGADALADDLARLRAGRPVAAMGRGRRYRLSRFVRRNALAVGAGIAAVLALVIGLGVAIEAYGRAERARVAEARRFGEVRALAGWMLFDLNEELARVPGNTNARVRLAGEAQRYLSALAATPGASPQLRLETARGLIRLAKVQGVPPEPNFGEWVLAKRNLATADAILAGLAAGGVAPATLAPDRATVDLYRALVRALSDGAAAEGKTGLERAERRLAAVPADQRRPAWHLARATLRRAQAELRYLAMDDPGVARAADLLGREVATWPAGMQRGRAAAEARAAALFYAATAQSAKASGDFGLPAMLAAKRALTALDARWRSDPGTLYTLTYLDYMLFESAARADRPALSSRAIADARARIDRLLALEANDNSLQTLDTNIEEAYATDLSNRGRFPEAIAAQRRVLAVKRARLTAARRPLALGDVGYATMMLGLIGRKAGDRALACDSWQAADAIFAELERRKALTGFHAAFLPGLRANVAKCRAGAPVATFGALR